MSALHPCLDGKKPLGYVAFIGHNGRHLETTPYYQGENPMGNLVLARAKAALAITQSPVVAGSILPSMLDRAGRQVSLRKGVRFLSQDWLHVNDPAVTAADPEYARYLRQCTRRQQIAYVRLMQASKGYPVGVECRHYEMERWGFVLPSVSSKEPWRIQMFDRFAFAGHICYSTLDEAIENLVRMGFHIPDAGALNRASTTRSWELTFESLENVRRANLKCA